MALWSSFSTARGGRERGREGLSAFLKKRSSTSPTRDACGRGRTGRMEAKGRKRRRVPFKPKEVDISEGGLLF